MKRFYALPAIFGLGLLLFVLTAWYEELEYMVFDLKTAILTPQVSDSIEVIAITSEDIKQAGGYPISEEYLSLLLWSLEKAGARQVMMDIYFSPYPSTLAQGSLLDQYLKSGRLNVVIGAPWDEMTMPVFSGTAGKTGFSNIAASRDGYVRMIPLHHDTIPSMVSLVDGGKKIYPGKENLLIPPYLSLDEFKAVRFFKAITLLNQTEGQARYRNKIVYLGYHIPGVSPFFLNPRSEELSSGLALQANFANAVLTGDYCVKTPIWLDMILTLLVMAVGIATALRYGPKQGWMMVAIGWVVYTVINLGVLKFGLWQVPLIYPLAAMTIMYSIVYFIRSFAEEKRLRQELQSSTILIQNVMRHFSGLAILFSPDADIWYSNTTPEISRQILAGEKVRSNLAAIGQKGAGLIGWDQAEKGRIHRFNLNLVPELKKLAGQDVHLLLSYDITESIELRNKLKEQEHLVSIGQMAAAIAHEIRNPLAGLELTAGTIRDKVRDRPEVQSCVTNMNLAIKSLNRFISEFLEFSRSMKLHRIKMNLVKVIGDSLFMIDWASKTIEVVKVFPEQLEILGDPDRLRQVVINVMNNAVQSIEEKGKITLRLEVLDQEVLFSIQDTGIGITPDDLPNVFDPFFTTRAEGTGLGLAICRKIMELHGGTIQLDSRPQSGTCALIRLPLWDREITK